MEGEVGKGRVRVRRDWGGGKRVGKEKKEHGKEKEEGRRRITRGEEEKGGKD